MRTLTISQARNQFGQFLELAQQEPVGVLRRGEVVGVLVSAQTFAHLQEHHQQHQATMPVPDVGTDLALAAGLTRADLDSLLREAC